jgi:putrescine transport system ATP-binding protein
LVQLDSGKVVRVTQPNTVRHAEDRLTWDERVWISWHESAGIVVTE